MFVSTHVDMFVYVSVSVLEHVFICKFLFFSHAGLFVLMMMMIFLFLYTLVIASLFVYARVCLC